MLTFIMMYKIYLMSPSGNSLKYPLDYFICIIEKSKFTYVGRMGSIGRQSLISGEYGRIDRYRALDIQFVVLG